MAQRGALTMNLGGAAQRVLLRDVQMHPYRAQVLHHDDDRAAIARWREAGRIYASTVNLLLLSPPLARAVRDQMRRMTTDPAE